jgi:hypothetical protein
MASKRYFGKAALVVFALAVASLMLGCASQLPRVIPPAGTPATAPDTTRQGPVAAPASSDSNLLALPASFRYRMVLHPAVQPDAPATLISGQYRDGTWQQTSRTGTGPEQVDEELVVARDQGGVLRSYTRAMTDTVWTRWPGVTFDASYGLASPFTVLRLRTLATETASPEGDGSEPAGTVKTQALFSPDTVRRLLVAGVGQIGADSESRAALEAQLAPFFMPQTLTFWNDAEGRIIQAAGTLLIQGPDGEPAPWLEMTAAYSDYGDAAIAVAAPKETRDIGEVAIADPGSVAAPAEAAAAAGITLRIRVFATAGQPAADAIVTIYPMGKKNVVDEKIGADAQFALNPGQYEVLVRAGGAEQWLKDVTVTTDAVMSNDVLFDFAPLTVAVVLGGAAPNVDVVVYPAGERVRFAGFASANPARFLLPAGLYDVEAATTDGSARKRVEGVEVRGGLETTQTIDLAQP